MELIVEDVPPLLCPMCSAPFERKQISQKFCRPLCRQQYRAVDGRRRVTERMTRACLRCQTSFTLKSPKQKYCSALCERAVRSERDREHRRLKTIESRVGRTCADCGASIADRMLSAKRCAPCYEKVRHRSPKDRQALGGSQKPPATRHIPPRRDAPKLGPVKEKKEKLLLPNFGGDWFPGWDGCWSPSLSAEGRALVEQYYGPAPTGDPTKKQEAA